jgi:quinol monooxygenase YgiN
MPEAITVLARLKAKDGMQETVKAEGLALVEPTRSEEGCIIYDFHHDTEDPALFMFYEQWVSKEALDAHLQKPYLQAFIAGAEQLLAGPLDVTIWKKLS